MDLLLQILGALALGLVAILAIVILIIVWKWKTIKALISSTQPVPSEATLVKDESPKWLDKAAAKKAILELEALGFQRGAAYTIEEIPSVKLLAFCHQNCYVMASLYEHDAIGLFLDMCANFADGMELTVTNAPAGSEMDTRPETEKIFMAETSIEEMFQEVKRRIVDASLLKVSNESFASEFEKAFKKDMVWNASRGGISEAEIRRVAENEDGEVSEEKMQEVMNVMKLQEINQWATECLCEFSNSTNISVAEWNKYEYEMFIFREDFHSHGFLTYLAETMDIEDEEALKKYIEMSADTAPVDLLSTICAEQNVKVKKLGEVESPIQAEIYGIEREEENST